ncbi:MAG: glycosyl hydrolase [Paeniglutamicibacter terrestris]
MSNRILQDFSADTTPVQRGGAPLRFGVNYTPTRGWFHHWLDFDIDQVSRDLDSIAELGADHIRAFALWPVFQPNRSLIRPQALADLAAVVDAAAERGLDVSVDGLQGHLSSFDYVPAWAQTWHQQNLFTSELVIEGQSAYLEAIAATLAGRPNFLGMSIGNEFSQFASPLHPNRSELTVAQADTWISTMLAACAAGAPGLEHHHSEYDMCWFGGEHSFTPALAARRGHSTTIHSWIFNGTSKLYGGMSEQSLRLAEYLIELGRGWSTDPNRPIWLQEIGAPAPHVSAEDAPAFLEGSLKYALDTENLWGVTWWSSHDVDTALADFPSLEYSLGLIGNDRTVKPQGHAFAKVAAEVRTAPAPARRSTALVLEVGDETLAPGRATCEPGGAFFEAWMSLAMDGARPSVILASQAGDASFLAARGITTVLTTREVSAGSAI